MLVGLLHLQSGSASRRSPALVLEDAAAEKVQKAECVRSFAIHVETQVRNKSDSTLGGIWTEGDLRPMILDCNRFIDYPVACPGHLGMGVGRKACAEVAQEVASKLEPPQQRQHCAKWALEALPDEPTEVPPVVKEVPTGPEAAMAAARPSVWKLLKEVQDSQDELAVLPAVPSTDFDGCMQVMFMWLGDQKGDADGLPERARKLLTMDRGRKKECQRSMWRKRNDLGTLAKQCTRLGFRAYEPPSVTDLLLMQLQPSAALRQLRMEIRGRERDMAESRERAYQEKSREHARKVAEAKKTSDERSRIMQKNKVNEPWLQYCEEVSHTLSLFDLFCATPEASTCNRRLREAEEYGLAEAMKQLVCAPCEHPDPLPDFQVDLVWDFHSLSPPVRDMHLKNLKAGKY